MKDTKDLFSKQSASYASFRPVYPDALFNFLFSITKHFDTAWDCGTGNGQVALRLSERFDKVMATDISQSQLSHAPQKDNIAYELTRAEQTSFADNSFDLITVGTALHWFDHAAFNKEVQRVAKNGAHIAAWAYATVRSEPAITAIADEFYGEIVHGYWDAERKLVDDEYRTIPFPFKELPAPKLEITAQWTKEHFIGYLNSWSAVQHYVTQNGSNPVDLIMDKLDKNWKDGEYKAIRFPLFMRVGQIVK
ncbi:MAG: class I SAM-dependent methyltransferase [Sphingobacteriales bacterium]|nr:MAG: class I SAM-dependent methyltransferase [Sphingobacteriales bacterium]